MDEYLAIGTTLRYNGQLLTENDVAILGLLVYIVERGHERSSAKKPDAGNSPAPKFERPSVIPSATTHATTAPLGFLGGVPGGVTQPTGLHYPSGTSCKSIGVCPQFRKD